MTVDNLGGVVQATGMQFTTNGYTLTGGPLTLVGPQSTIRVGDGTPTGAGVTTTIDAELTGATQLVKTDLGTLVLTGTNTYTGGTAIDGGVLQIGDGGTSGAIVGDVASTGGALTFNRSDTITFDGVYSGVGQLRQQGAGTLILTGNNTSTGQTRVTVGSLQIGDGGTSGSIAGDVFITSGELVFNRSDTLTYAGDIASSVPVIQAGTGTTILTGNKSGAGTTSVNAGTLLINGASSSTGLTSVAANATLGGIGTIGGAVNVADNGILAAGSNGVGKLTINGGLTLGAASVMNFELGDATQPGGPLNDLIIVGGALDLGGVVNVAESAGGTFWTRRLPADQLHRAAHRRRPDGRRGAGGRRPRGADRGRQPGQPGQQRRLDAELLGRRRRPEERQRHPGRQRNLAAGRRRDQLDRHRRHGERRLCPGQLRDLLGDGGHGDRGQRRRGRRGHGLAVHDRRLHHRRRSADPDRTAIDRPGWGRGRPASQRRSTPNSPVRPNWSRLTLAH